MAAGFTAIGVLIGLAIGGPLGAVAGGLLGGFYGWARARTRDSGGNRE